ncbi:MAG: DNA polymerase I, partial [Syntrophobacteraceae bacterium]|nr:DNA polymerase I [Syntrophobacteraceae bacterium]
ACVVPISSEVGGLKEEAVLHALEPLLGSTSPGKIGHNLKEDCVLLRRHGIKLEGLLFDTMVGSYLLNPGRGTHTVERIAAEFLGESRELQATGTDGGKSSGGLERIDGDRAGEIALARARVVRRLAPEILRRLREANLEPLFSSLELPLVGILAEMELRGILVDDGKLRSLTVDLEKALSEKAAIIHDLAKEEFNIQSPRQLASVLFDKLGLPVLKKTKSGPSTDMSVLEELAVQHRIAEEVMVYRTLAKLKGTYADTLPTLIHPDTGRIHTSYNQAVTATGRLSSSDPNLQNIPIRTETGRIIRRAFIAPARHVLLSADYSQIELRILAHFSADEHLVEAFQAGADVHLRTAAEMLNVPPHEVTQEMRRQAKTINFGIIYGMGPYGLARRLRISNKMAKAAIEQYFDRYRGVKQFIESTIEKARDAGYTETLLGRRRWIPELKSRNFTVRQQGERLAVNTPIQGTAADLIKKSMIDVHQKLRQRGLKTAMLLQVHDELVFEVPEDYVDDAVPEIRKLMCQAASLDAPLEVDIGVGRNWDEAH